MKTKQFDIISIGAAVRDTFLFFKPADVVVLDGFTRATGRSDAFARRQARNTQLVLMEEANLGRVDDPAAGDWTWSEKNFNYEAY